MNEHDVIESERVESVPPSPGDSDGRHLSYFRVFLVVAVVAAAIGGTWWYFQRQSETAAEAAKTNSWFAPYVDVTLTPQYAFEDGSSGAVLSFVVSAPDEPCDPSWGGAYTMTQASDSLDLDRRVARLRQLGGQVVVSFGGAANSELSIGCTDPADLTAAYTAVVDRYSVNTIDLDIEGSAASTPEVNARRAAAMAALTTAKAAAGEPVGVWLTLPVGFTGLTSEGLGVLNSMLAAGVPLAGVNGMTMDYGEPLPAGKTMADQSELALTALQQQVKTAYAATGRDLSDREAWQLVGATPMIGQNDIHGEIFSIADAQQLVAFGLQHQLRRLAMWSANRDQSCGPNYPDVAVVSNVCSGVEQTPGQFASIFKVIASGQSTPVTETTAPTASSEAPTAVSTAQSAGEIVDDPATSPYAIWNVNQAYPKGTKVVWHKNVYQAKWYTQGDQPDLPVATADQTPWTLIGPVLPGDTPAPTPTFATGTYPEWNATDVYVAGSRVLLDGVGYQAKYWTQGDQPGAVPTTPDETSPWQLLTAP